MALDRAEHRVEMAHLVAERRAAGKPSWEQTVSLSHINPDLPFEELRDALVAALRATRWVKEADQFGRLVEAVDGLAAAEDREEFNGWMDEIYDCADYDRVWIKTR